MMENKILQLTQEYKQIIDSFKKNSDVLIGEIGFKRDGVNVEDNDRPASLGYGLGLTGYCVSASRFLLESWQFQQFLEYRNAKAKLISIDIKEQYYGYCYNGSQNYWHTAILVEDKIDGQKFLFVIDITIRQFGNEFVDKDIWNFDTWKEKLRSPNCTHQLTDFDGSEHTILPVNLLKNKYDVSYVNDIKFVELKDNLKRNITLNTSDRTAIVDFILDKMDVINRGLILGEPTSFDSIYMGNIKEILSKLYYEYNENKMYSILKFHNRDALANWTKKFTETLKFPQFLPLFYSIEKACNFHDIDISNLNNTATYNCDFYLVFEFDVDSMFFPIIESNILDGLLLHNTELLVTELRNTGSDIDKEFNTIKCVLGTKYK